jgi:hypothetical protein
MGRWILFLLSILLGAALGLLYGWVVNPVEYIDTAPDSLRVDYKADYVLMVAEAYSLDRDLPAAARRLALLGDAEPLEFARQAIMFGSQQGYNEADLALMRKLASDLQSWSPAPGLGSP